MDLIIRDVPESEEVQKEIIENAMTTISNYLKRSIPKSSEEIEVDSIIFSIKEKNVIKKSKETA